jgi:hypothetical protein
MGTLGNRMRLTSFLRSRASLARLGASARVAALATLAVVAVGGVARASGPVERLVQVLLHPTNPDVIVVRWGLASDGYLISRDGGRTFSAFCSDAITASNGAEDSINHLSSKSVSGLGATLIDAQGRLMLAQNGALWSDDGSGCSWNQVPGFEGFWPYSLLRDPGAPDELLAVVNLSSGEFPDLEARARLLRRAADGSWQSWEQAGSIFPDVPGQRAYGSELVAAATEAGTRLYATADVSRGPISANEVQTHHIVTSTDGGRTWSEGFPLGAELAANFVLLAVDPRQPRRVLGAQVSDNAADVLWLSEDEGKSFTNYGQVRAVSAVTFAPDGRVYIADSGDSTSGEDAIGGLWTAAQLGQPLVKVDNTDSLDCLAWSEPRQTLYACVRDRFGTLDPQTGAFQQVTRMSEVGALVSCAGFDVRASCEAELNAGPSWCCTGHFPFTPLCGDYDVSMADGRRVFCGQAGRRYDEMNGLGPRDAGSDAAIDASVDEPGEVDATVAVPDATVRDAGARDASRDAESAASGHEDGCAIGVHHERPRRVGGALFSLGLFLFVLGRSLRRRTPR